MRGWGHEVRTDRGEAFQKHFETIRVHGQDPVVLRKPNGPHLLESVVYRLDAGQ